MRLVQRIQLKPAKMLKELAKMTNSLYNYANYIIRQSFFHSQNWIRYTDMNIVYSFPRKAVPKAFMVDGIKAVGLHPLSIAVQ